MAKPAKAAAPSTAKVEASKPKNVRSDRLPKRVSIDKRNGLVITGEHHTVLAGRVDRGVPTAPFSVRSISKRTGEVIITHHQTDWKADKAAEGRLAHHHSIRVRDNRPASTLLVVPTAKERERQLA